MKYFFVGFMGCGKTSVASKFAKSINHSFIDMDAWIEQQEQKSVSEIFSTSGESYFRALETNMLDKAILSENVVISTGGGAPCFNNNMQKMNEIGFTVYLKADNEILLGRLKLGKEKRPLIANLSTEELRNYISQKLAEREKYYLQAKQILEMKNLSVNQIIKLLKKI